MSIVVIDIDNDYCDELVYSYQLCKDDDGTYSVYVARDFLRGYTAVKSVDTFEEAWNHLKRVLEENEHVYA